MDTTTELPVSCHDDCPINAVFLGRPPKVEDIFSSNCSLPLNITGNFFRRIPRDLSGEVRIPLYTIIFLLAVVGNSLVIVALVQNKRMRTVTNVFLLNLSVSDLLLAVFCMPFTLIPVLLKNFIFGATMCVLIRYLQGVSVAVSCFTLVALSLERYYAICQPLTSRSWQTLSHSYKAIGVCWGLGIAIMSPIALYTRLHALTNGRFACKEVWKDHVWEKVYTVLLDIFLLVLPLLIMSVCYGSIMNTLWMGMKMESKTEKGNLDEEQVETNMFPISMETESGSAPLSRQSSPRSFRNRYSRIMRQSNFDRTKIAKKRVIKMLFAVILEFFVCWTPLYVLTTWKTFHLMSLLQTITPMTMSLIHLLSYISSCCNPITYCFMNRKFRQGFITVFRRMRCWEKGRWTGCSCGILQKMYWLSLWHTAEDGQVVPVS
ncbi:cholecystokinin receptor type A-like [Liolophura sinensis]|uniref:cholecystokinin receptor type A-like n=1 Tax=Liolophura sinensis TaxID=3198878 RepID=UPI0031580C6E